MPIAAQYPHGNFAEHLCGYMLLRRLLVHLILIGFYSPYNIGWPVLPFSSNAVYTRPPSRPDARATVGWMGSTGYSHRAMVLYSPPLPMHIHFVLKKYRS